MQSKARKRLVSIPTVDDTIEAKCEGAQEKETTKTCDVKHDNCGSQWNFARYSKRTPRISFYECRARRVLDVTES